MGKILSLCLGDFPNTKGFNFGIKENNPEEIGAGVIQDNWTTLFSLYLNNESQFYTPIDNTGVGYYYVIPWSYIKDYLTLTKEYNYFITYNYNEVSYTIDNIVTYGGSSPEDAFYNNLNTQNNLLREQNANQEIMINQQQQTTEAINNLNDTMTDSNIESGASDLPSINVTDPTANGIDNIFQSIYNAFCTGQAIDIVFPIPFTNKSITLSPNYVKDMLINNGASWLYTLIQAYWGYLIGRYIVKDVSKKITKIKGGNIENLENENIKEDML